MKAQVPCDTSCLGPETKSAALCRTHLQCGELQSSWLYLRPFDLAHVRLDGRHIGTLWRAIPPRLRVHKGDCGDPSATVELAITVFSYGRDNFFSGGVPSAISKGLVGHVRLVPARGQSRALTGWRVAALPLVQPGRVLQWDGQPSKTTTAELVRQRERLPFDSLHGGAWHHTVLRDNQGDHAEVACNGCWQRAYSGHGPTFYRCDPLPYHCQVRLQTRQPNTVTLPRKLR